MMESLKKTWKKPVLSNWSTSITNAAATSATGDHLGLGS